ncbi:hypothetical protein ACHAQH_007095 [Verticillium albo-atrum]
MSTSNTIIIGGGVAAIAMAHKLKIELGHHDFAIYKKRSGPGGTWIANTYPGCSDVPIHLYSFSFNLNLSWTQALADQEEILESQVVPAIAPSVKKVTQLFTNWDKFCFKYTPLWQRWHRLDLFLKTDQLASIYGSDESQVTARLALEEEARQYILSEAPEKYHDFILPKFPLGCKRRIYDPGYLASLRRDNVELLAEGIQEFTETGHVSEKGTSEDVDAVILATGFSVSSFLAPMKIVGRNGKSLHEQLEEHRGAQAYIGTFVHNHPNFAILLVNSVMYSIKVQVDYIANILVKPIINGYASTIEVGPEPEEAFMRDLDGVLAETVFAAGCSNWYINSAGRNSAAWPDLAATFYKATFFPK